MSHQTTRPARPPWRVSAASALVDAAFIVGFTAMGRNSHAREGTLAGLWETSWPFLAGLALSWLIAGAWRAPIRPLRTGLPLTVGTVIIAMLLRVLAEQGTALPFVLVAAGTITVLLIGWRAVTAAIAKARRRSVDPAMNP